MRAIISTLDIVALFDKLKHTRNYFKTCAQLFQLFIIVFFDKLLWYQNINAITLTLDIVAFFDKFVQTRNYFKLKQSKK